MTPCCILQRVIAESVTDSALRIIIFKKRCTHYITISFQTNLYVADVCYIEKNKNLFHYVFSTEFLIPGFRSHVSSSCSQENGGTEAKRHQRSVRHDVSGDCEAGGAGCKGRRPDNETEGERQSGPSEGAPLEGSKESLVRFLFQLNICFVSVCLSVCLSAGIIIRITPILELWTARTRTL